MLNENSYLYLLLCESLGNPVSVPSYKGKILDFMHKFIKVQLASVVSQHFCDENWLLYVIRSTLCCTCVSLYILTFHSAKNFKNLSFCKSFVRAGSRTARQCILMFIHRKRRSLSLSTDFRQGYTQDILYTRYCILTHQNSNLPLVLRACIIFLVYFGWEKTPHN